MGNRRQGLLSPRRLIDQYFLEERNPYSKRRAFNMRNLLRASGIAMTIFVVCVISLGGREEGKEQAVRPDFKAPSGSVVSPTNQALALTQGQGGAGQNASSGFSGLSIGSGGGGGTQSIPTRSANQVIRRGAGGNDPGAALPLGSAVPVRLLNAVRSTDSTSPVVAEVTDDIFAHGTLSIPAGTRAIGNARYDEGSRRIQLRFQNFVYPDGDQHAVQAVGMMPDGSAGLDGDYHSGEGKRQLGRFLGHFIGGMADGMKNRQAGGSFGMAYEPGSIRNGLLNGVTLSAEDQASAYTEDLSRTQPFMTLQAGQAFVLFLEREYIP